jgi:hypothetical protein
MPTKRKIRNTILWIVAVCLIGYLLLSCVLVMIFGLEPTTVSFQSSDGEWADSEDLWKGRTFEQIVFFFELYKIKCVQPDSRLQRITKKPKIYTLENWANDYRDLKWHIPYVEPLPNTEGGHYPPLTREHCDNIPVSQQQLDLAHQRATQYIERMKHKEKRETEFREKS